MLKQKRGLFGSGPAMPMASAMSGGMTTAQEPMKPKFFGEGGVGRAIAGNIGDFLLQQSGMDPIYAPVMQQRQAMQYDQQQRELQRRQGLEDWVAKQEWEAKNRPPTYFDDNAGNRWAIGADGKPKLAFRDPTQKYVQQVVTDPDGSQRLIQVPVPNNVNPDGTFGDATLGGQSSGPPQAAISALRGNPALRDQFNQKYGPGAAERYLGGASGNAGGNF